ncbi:uncharacterized protein LOC6561196 [Drosophila grimshawi]|uniref:GH21013 n=1 Tax=Drosophila grimshawi TaxID=7222 RepID=B4J555_DROGR|nr:uncharacterized protein LOC6561196 [Drosophila grimshawi]EDW00681.1 GH21013 [Drosophila grimshawi]
MATQLNLQLPFSLSTLLLLLLLLLHFLGSPCETHKVCDNQNSNPAQHNVTEKISVVPKNETKQVSKDEIKDKPTNPSKNETRQQPQNMTKVNATEQPMNATKEYPKVNLVSPKKPIDIGPRITLDSLPVCEEGFKLFGTHCRKEA